MLLLEAAVNAEDKTVDQVDTTDENIRQFDFTEDTDDDTDSIWLSAVENVNPKTRNKRKGFNIQSYFKNKTSKILNEQIFDDNIVLYSSIDSISLL